MCHSTVCNDSCVWQETVHIVEPGARIDENEPGKRVCLTHVLLHRFRKRYNIKTVRGESVTSIDPLKAMRKGYMCTHTHTHVHTANLALKWPRVVTFDLHATCIFAAPIAAYLKRIESSRVSENDMQPSHIIFRKFSRGTSSLQNWPLCMAQ